MSEFDSRCFLYKYCAQIFDVYEMCSIFVSSWIRSGKGRVDHEQNCMMDLENVTTMFQ